MSRTDSMVMVKIANAARELARVIEAAGADPTNSLDDQTVLVLDMVRLMCRGLISVIFDGATPHA